MLGGEPLLPLKLVQKVGHSVSKGTSGSFKQTPPRKMSGVSVGSGATQPAAEKNGKSIHWKFRNIQIVSKYILKY